MVIQNAVKNLKENGTKDDKVAVASGIAVSVVLVLLVAWAIYFLHRIQSGSQQVNLSAGAQDQFNPQAVNDAQQQLQQQLGDQSSQFQEIQQQAAQGGNAQMQTAPTDVQGQGGTDQFGTPASGY